MRRALTFAGLVVGAALLLAAAGSPRGIKEGGTFRVAAAIGLVSTIDPALPKLPLAQSLLDPACGTLMAYPDKPRPYGYRLEPSLAEAEPVVSKDGRTFTFTIRKDARFSTGQPVTARAYARTLERILNPAMKSELSVGWLIIAGAQEVIDGKAATPRGIVANGRNLTLKLTKRVSAPELAGLLAGLCAVPPSLQADPEGAKAPLPSPAPYYVAEYAPGERLVLERNRFYRGDRPDHVARFRADLAVDLGSAVDLVAQDTFDTVFGINAVAPRSEELAKRYGVNKPGGRFFVAPGAGLRVFHLNTSRPLFRKNPKLRQAVNFAVDRKALAREAGFLGEIPTDQYLLPGSPGHKDERIYPLKRPNLKKALALAKGRTRGGRAVLYTTTMTVDISQAQILQKNLRAIGLDLEIRTGIPAERLAGEPFDLARVRWFGGSPESLAFWFDGRTIGQPGFGNLSYFNSPKYNRLLDEASRLTGAARLRAYGELDVQISRDAAPMIPVSRVSTFAFVSSRVGCVVMNPALDLTAVCLK
jgi:ABC-type oligopeptide transport system substrate-binding subunit